jgi:hypothetical protein
MRMHSLIPSWVPLLCLSRSETTEGTNFSRHYFSASDLSSNMADRDQPGMKVRDERSGKMGTGQNTNQPSEAPVGRMGDQVGTAQTGDQPSTVPGEMMDTVSPGMWYVSPSGGMMTFGRPGMICTAVGGKPMGGQMRYQPGMTPMEMPGGMEGTGGEIMTEAERATGDVTMGWEEQAGEHAQNLRAQICLNPESECCPVLGGLRSGC